MKKSNILILPLLLIPIIFFTLQRSITDNTKIEWSLPKCITCPPDTDYIQFALPVLSIRNPENIIIPYVIGPSGKSIGYTTNVNLFVKELRNGVLSESINLTNSIYNTNQPSIKTDRKGTTHLIWGQNLTIPNGRPTIQWSTDIYYSFYNSGLWSTPESIFHKDTSGQGYACQAGPLKLRTDYHNRLHLIWKAGDFITGSHFYHKVEENGKWSEEKLMPFLSADFDFIFDKNDRLHIVTLGPEYSGGYDVNSVFYHFSDDYGETWSDSVLVHKSGSYRALKVQILLDNRNNIHIVWTKDLGGNYLGGDAIYHSFSSDGINWTGPIDAVPRSSDGFQYFSTTIDIKNNIHLVYDLWKGFVLTPTKLCYVIWDGTKWSGPVDIFYDAEMPFIELDGSNYLHISFADINKGYKYYSRTTAPLITNVDKKKVIPDNFELYQNFPNPFNPETSIEYKVGSGEYVSLKVYDLRGKEIAVLVNEYKSPGVYNYGFSAAELNLSSGVYFYQLKAGVFIETKKFVLLK